MFEMTFFFVLQKNYIIKFFKSDLKYFTYKLHFLQSISAFPNLLVWLSDVSNFSACWFSAKND